MGKQGFIEPDKLPEFGSSVSEFDSKLEDHVVSGGWVVEKPSRVVARWVGKGVLAILAGGAGIFLGVNLPASGLVIIGAAAIAGGIVVCLFAPSMPRVTMPGAMVRRCSPHTNGLSRRRWSRRARCSRSSTRPG
jgi:hypothetical protein